MAATSRVQRVKIKKGGKMGKWWDEWQSKEQWIKHWTNRWSESKEEAKKSSHSKSESFAYHLHIICIYWAPPLPFFSGHLRAVTEIHSFGTYAWLPNPTKWLSNLNYTNWPWSCLANDTFELHNPNQTLKPSLLQSNIKFQIFNWCNIVNCNFSYNALFKNNWFYLNWIP